MTVEGKKNEEQKTSLETASIEDKNNNQVKDDTLLKTENIDEETVTIDAKELKTLRNKARDFDGISSKKDKDAFLNKHTDADPAAKVNIDEIVARAKDEALMTFKEEQKAANMNIFKQNLGTALDSVVGKYKFLDSKALAKINESFEAGDALSVEQITAKLNKTVQQEFPVEYEGILKKKLQNEILSEKPNIDLGGTGEGSSVHKEPQSLTEGDKMKKKFNDNLPPGFVA